MKRNMTARAQAKERGDKTYETGIPCKQGHTAPRATLTGTCIQCTKEASKRWLAARPGQGAEYVARYRARNRDAIIAYDRQYKAHLRATKPEVVKEIKRRSYAKVKFESTGESVRPFNRLTEGELEGEVLRAHKGAIVYVGGYVSKNAPAMFRCTIHGVDVEARPGNVCLGANPCIKCNHMKSASEDALHRYLSTFTQAVQRDRAVIAPKELDIYLPEHKLAIEYCGMYWHSAMCVEDEPEMRKKHQHKYDMAAAQGVRVITMYESEWQERPQALRRLLRNAIGKGRGRLMARKCDLRKVSQQEATAFFERYHPQGGTGYGEHYALVHNNKIVACMRFTKGINDRGNARRRIWTLARYATRITIAGGASRLFKAFVREFAPTEVKSFSDNRYFDGGMYRALGFELDAQLPPDYQVWSPKIGLKPKPHYQRRALPARQRDHGVRADFDPTTDARTEAQMTYAMGCGRIYDCGKKRWVWKAA